MAKNLISSNSATINESGDNIYVKVTETGSNANGNWIKYEDGTMICWNHMEVTDQAINNAYGSLYQGTRTIYFPVEFVAVPSVHCSLFHWGNGASWGCVNNASTAETTIRGIDIASRSTGTTCEISWIAIGKWK